MSIRGGGGWRVGGWGALDSLLVKTKDGDGAHELKGMPSACLVISARVSPSWPQRPLGGGNQRQVLLAPEGSAPHRPPQGRGGGVGTDGVGGLDGRRRLFRGGQKLGGSKGDCLVNSSLHDFLGDLKKKKKVLVIKLRPRSRDQVGPDVVRELENNPPTPHSPNPTQPTPINSSFFPSHLLPLLGFDGHAGDLGPLS